jgi:pyridoxal 5'-phosphate synthase pdxS subunit
VFVGSGIFLCENPQKRAKAIVNAVTDYQSFDLLAKHSTGLGEAMHGTDIKTIADQDRFSARGW